MSQSEIKVAVVGGGGYAGAELIRLLVAHPAVSLTHATARSHTGQSVASVYPHLLGLTELIFTEHSPVQLTKEVDVLFLALPHGATMEVVQTLFDKEGQPLGGAAVIDLSGDFRLEDAALYTKHYGVEHSCPELMERFTYGLTEWNGARVSESRYIANPGCFATAIGLALSPLADSGLLPERVTVFAATGSTGSGHRAKRGTHHPERATNFKLYKVLAHQHIPEIEAQLERLGAQTSLSFIPASAPMTHGIFATCHMVCEDPAALATCIEEAYEKAPFVRVRPSSPQMNWVVGSNFADVGLFEGDSELVVVCAIDNMLKGAAGQAIQNMNLMLGMDQRTGLCASASLP
jgi:N-acetyl-gamma-glutamyl-phosphate reductase